MNNTLLVAGEIFDYGSTQKEELLVVPSAMMMDRNYHTNTKHPSSSPSWNTKKAVVLGIIGLMAVVVSSATLFFSVIMNSSGQARTQSFLLHDGGSDGTKQPANLQGYPYVTITNNSPYDALPGYKSHLVYGTYVEYGAFCSRTFVDKGIAYGDTWTAPSRGGCSVTRIFVNMKRPDLKPDGSLSCTPYTSSGTRDLIYSIIQDGDDCCVRGSHQSQKCS